MNNTESLRNWGIIIAVLLGGVVLSAVWPAIGATLTGNVGGTSVTVPQEPTIIEYQAPTSIGTITLPEGIAGTTVTLTGFQAFGILLALVVAPVVGIGLVIGFGYRLLAKQVEVVTADETYKEGMQTLEQRTKERMKHIRDGRETTPIPDHTQPGWSSVSNALITIMFMAFVAYLINGVFFPESEYITETGHIVNTSSWIVLITMGVTALLLFIRIRPQVFSEVEAADKGPIPWDTIVVLITGLLVLGLGIGFMISLNL